MERKIIWFILCLFTVVSCSDNDLDMYLAYAGAISDVCVDWGADKDAVAEYMKDNEVKYESSTTIDYYLSDKEYYVTYSFDDEGLRYSALIVKEETPISSGSFFGDWEYLGSSLEMDAGKSYTSMVDFYIKEKQNLFVTTYSVEHNNATYRVFGFAELKNLLETVK